MDATPIEIVDHDPAWAERFAAERKRLREWIRAYTARIEHVGSTSVPGLGAKPIVDITAVVTDVEGLWGNLDKLNAALGYELSHIPGDWLFLQRVDGTGVPYDLPDQPFNLHLIPVSDEQWKHDLRFREYLRANPDARDEYEAAKREAAAAHPDDIDAYNAAKADACESILEAALADDAIEVPEPPDA